MWYAHTLWLRAALLWLLPSLALAGSTDFTWTRPQWNTNGSAIGTITGFRLYERCAPTGAFTLVQTFSGSAVSGTRSGHADGTTCYWQLATVTALGEGLSGTVQRVVPPVGSLPAPTNLVITWAPTQGQGPPSMAAVLTGTPTAVTWASGSDPTGQSITIPSDATAVYMFWQWYIGSSGHGLSSATLNGNAPAQMFEVATAAGDKPASGVAVWYNPATGSQTLDVAWDQTPAEGPTTIVAYVKDGDTTAWRDADALNGQAGNAVSVTLTTVAGDLVLKFDSKDGAAPSLSSGWTSGQTTTNNGDGSRLSYISASGSTQVCDSEGEAYSAVVAVSIPAGAAAAVTSLVIPNRAPLGALLQL